MISQTANNVGHFLRHRAYPGRGAAKRLARDLGCSVSTAKLLLAGRSVTAWMDALVDRFGWALLRAVYDPQAAGSWDAASGEDLAAIRRQLARVEALLAGRDGP